ncbi:MAG TPA: sulfatase-like hydrolase/transferase [Acidobacteriota bacterium]|jgi:arylsulfatase A-like enzyme/Flp pilus assembly protein TadD|nr:sulfatase-like hydrolase/transferase [Acidobacteriota bacterium]
MKIYTKTGDSGQSCMHFRFLFCILVFASGQTLWAQPSPPPRILFISLDTVRPDHLEPYGYTKIKTPHLAELARNGVLFKHAYTAVPITLPSHAVMLTGTYPMVNGIRDFSGNVLDTKFETLAEVLKKGGYKTAAFIGGAVLDSRFGLNQGFDDYLDRFDINSMAEANLDLIDRPAGAVIDEALSWMEKASGRFFVWIHLYDAHYPYAPPEPFRTEYTHQLYDGEIAYADSQLGRLFDFMKRKGWWDSALVLAVGDHGEGLGEHAESYHGFFIYDSTLHVPLIIKAPGIRPGRIDSIARTIDLYATILQIAGLAIPPQNQGYSLLGKLLGKDSSAQEAYAETLLPNLHFGWSDLRSLRRGNLKLIDAPRPELYDLAADPDEGTNLFQSRRAMAAPLKEELAKWLQRNSPREGEKRAGNAEHAPQDPALIEKLKSLGYIAVSSPVAVPRTGKGADPKDKIQTAELITSALSLGQKGKYDESLAQLQKAEKDEPDNIAILHLKGLNYYRKRDFPSALEIFKRALAIAPNNAMASYFLALSYLNTGDLDAAIVGFRRTVLLDSTHFLAQHNLGAALVRKRQYQEAIEAFRNAVRIYPDYRPSLQALGEMYLFENKPDQAIEVLEHAAQLAPEDARPLMSLARAYAQKGNEAKAQELLQKARSKSHR